MNPANPNPDSPAPSAERSLRSPRRRLGHATVKLAALCLVGSLLAGCVGVIHPRSSRVVVKPHSAKKTIVVRGHLRPRVGCWRTRGHWVCPAL